jgi:hypothetical protein
MFSKSHPIIIYIDRLGFSVYQETLVNIPKFNFTPDLVANLDVINKEQLTNFISTFVQVNKITPSSIVIVLSDYVIFVKDLADSIQKPDQNQNPKENSGDIKDHRDEVQSFLEDIPFEDVLAKVIRVGNVDRIVAANKEIIMAIADVFTNNKSTVESIVPAFAFGQNANFSTGLTLDNAKIILGDMTTLKLSNLLTDQEKILPTQKIEGGLNNLSTTSNLDPTSTNVKKPKNLRQYSLVGVFGILLVVLVIVIANSVAEPTPKSYKARAVMPTVIPTAIPTLAVASKSATIDPIEVKEINIEISHSAQSWEVTSKLRKNLSEIGFQNITDEISETSIPEKSSIIFSENISTDLRNNIIIEIKEILPNISISEGQDIENEINISIGKS